MSDGERVAVRRQWQAPDVRRTLQLALAAVWLLDGVLQLQPFMFTPGANGFSGMIGATATGNPHPVASAITWTSGQVDHHAVVANAMFALVQVLIGFGIAWRPTVRLALAASIPWSMVVWWFGEGLGGILHGAGTPLGGGPGAVVFYALLAVLLWPTDRVGAPAPFAAAQFVGVHVARRLWWLVFAGMALLSVLGAARSPQGTHDLIVSLELHQPGWLVAIDRHVASMLDGHGLTVAVLFATVWLTCAFAPYLPRRATRALLVAVIALAAGIWVVGEAFGGILAGGATDPNSGPVLLLFALCYWPLATSPHAVEQAPSADVHRLALAGAG